MQIFFKMTISHFKMHISLKMQISLTENSTEMLQFRKETCAFYKQISVFKIQIGVKKEISVFR